MTKSKILVIGDAPLVMGFKLAGLENGITATDADFASLFEDALSRSEFGILITNERLLNLLDWRMKKKLETLAYPVVVPMPEYSGKSEAGDEIRNLIKRALGFDLGKK
ncbi:V-type ATP synthase subunit F [Candidatus Micrarchaeota archaeon]|nr:V-type ATP synthase subunit F [Candidatus Micrarchaeota archaeon]